MYQFFQQIAQKFTKLETCPHRLAISTCVGVFLACAPFLGIQTVLAFILSFITNLNGSIVLITLFLVNNPLTMVPIIMADYGTGYIIFEKGMALNTTSLLPSWMHAMNVHIDHTLQKFISHGNFSVGNYLFGGLVFGLICSLFTYPVAYLLSKKYIVPAP